MKTNGTHSFLLVSSFHSNGDDGFTFSTSPWLAGALSANEELINLDSTLKLFTLIADCAASELLKPSPSSAVAAKAQELL